MLIQDNQRLAGRVGASLPSYEFNDTYDQKHLHKTLFWSLNKLYTRALEAQGRLCHMYRYNGKMSEFKRDRALNNKFDLPYNTYSITLPLNTINFFTRKSIKELATVAWDYSNKFHSYPRELKNFSKREFANEGNQKRFIYHYLGRCAKEKTNVLEYPDLVGDATVHTPDYKFDYDDRYGWIITRDKCFNNYAYYYTGLTLDKLRFPYLYNIQETYGRPELFTHHFTVFINGYIFADAKFFVDTNHLYVFLRTNNPAHEGYENELINEWTIKEWIEKDAPFTIMGFPFSTTQAFDGSLANKWNDLSNYIPFSSFDAKYTASMKLQNNLWLLGYSDNDKSKFFLIPCIAKLEKFENSLYMKNILDPHMREKLVASKKDDFYVEAFNLKYAAGISNIGTEREFQIPLTRLVNGKEIKGNPIPPSNVMLFEYKEDSSLRFIHEAKISLYYPNVYSIRNVPDDINIVIIWFHNDEMTEWNRFDDPLKNYISYNPSYAFDMLRKNLPSYIQDYIPAVVEYDYTVREVNRRSSKSYYEDYVIDKVADIAKDNPERYEYIYTTLMERTGLRLHANPKQVVKLSEIEGFDLNELAVNDNEKSKSKYSITKVFLEPHIMFSIEHSENWNYKYAVWIDGIQYNLQYIDDNLFTTYFYLPVSKLNPDSTVEVEMMRVRDKYRVVAEIDFNGIDTSIELPKVFADVSPQSMMISIRRENPTAISDTEVNPGYYQYLDDESVYVQGEIGVKYHYRVAPDHEMNWLLFGYNRYLNGYMINQPADTFHTTKIIEIPYFDEDGKPTVGYVEREKCTHMSLEEAYSRVPNLDWTTGSTQMITLRENDLVVNDNPDRVVFDHEIMMPLQTAISRDYFISASDGEIPQTMYVTTFDSPWPNGFYALERRRFYQYLNYGEDSPTIYITPIGKPFAKEVTEVITQYHNDTTGETQKVWVAGNKIDTGEFIMYSPSHRRWFGIKDDLALSSTTETNLTDVYFAVAASFAKHDENIFDVARGKIITRELNSGLTASQLTSMYNVITLKKVTTDSNSHPYGLSLMHNKLNSTDTGANFMLVYYSTNPQIPDAELLNTTPIVMPKSLLPNISHSYDDIIAIRAEEPMRGYILEEKHGRDTDFEEWYVNPEYPRSFFEYKHALIQNTDIYFKLKFTINFLTETSFTTDHFYDDPSFHKFRLMAEGRRLDHGTDYETDVNLKEGYLRGSPIHFRLDKNSTTVIRAIRDTYSHAERLYGSLIMSSKSFYEMINKNSDGSYVFSTSPTVLKTGVIYNDLAHGGNEYYWTGTDFEPFDDSMMYDNGNTYLDIYLEYLPYKDRIVWKSRILSRRVITVPDETLERPLSFAYYDFYLNGKKLNSDDMEIITARRMKLKSHVILDNVRLTIYERCHDPDLYGNVGYMPDTIDDLIASKDPKYKEFLCGADPYARSK